MMCRANFVVGKQVNFWIIERDQWQFAAGNAQLYALGELRRESLQIGFQFRPGDGSTSIGIHHPAFARGPLLEKSQVHGDVNVLRADRQMNPVLHILPENVVSLCTA